MDHLNVESRASRSSRSGRSTNGSFLLLPLSSLLKKGWQGSAEPLEHENRERLTAKEDLRPPESCRSTNCQALCLWQFFAQRALPHGSGDHMAERTTKPFHSCAVLFRSRGISACSHPRSQEAC